MQRIFGQPAEENMDNTLLHLAWVLSLIFLQPDVHQVES